MEQSGEPHSEHGPVLRGLPSKRLKELENAALQSTLMSQMEVESGADAENMIEQQPGEGDQLNGLPRNHRAALPTLGEDTEAGEMELGGNVAKERLEEERTLTDHLNKRLLSSFLEKLNERDLALPGVQRLDCAVADEDSNRAADEWWRTGQNRRRRGVFPVRADVRGDTVPQHGQICFTRRLITESHGYPEINCSPCVPVNKEWVKTKNAINHDHVI